MKISILSLNVRGLRNQVKRTSIFRFLKDQTVRFTSSRKHSRNKKMNRYGRVSGEVLFSFPTGQPIVKEFLF